MDQHSIWIIKNLIASMFLPPFNFFLLGAAGFFLLKRKPGLGKSLLAISLALLYLLSTPFIANSLMGRLEKNIAPVTLAQARSAQAIIILGGGVYHDAPEYGADTVNALTLARVEYGAYLHQQTGLPILVTGGSPEQSKPEAYLMQQSLQRDFKVPVRWLEDRAYNTAQNAEFSAALLHPAKINKVLVVSHAWHLPRALIEFEKHGLQVIPAPTRFGAVKNPKHGPDVFDFIPQARALLKSHYALHEMIGIAWYRFSQ